MIQIVISLLSRWSPVRVGVGALEITGESRGGAGWPCPTRAQLTALLALTLPACPPTPPLADRACDELDAVHPRAPSTSPGRGAELDWEDR
jgi:hypothetical protein